MLRGITVRKLQAYTSACMGLWMTGAALAQPVAESLLIYEGQTFNHQSQTLAIKAIRGLQINSAGGYAALVDFVDGRSGVVGRTSSAQSADQVLSVTGELLGFRRVRMDSQFGLSATGQLVLSCLLDRGECSVPKVSKGFSDSLWWEDSAVLGIEDVPVESAHPTRWGVFSLVGSTSSGSPWWVASRYEPGTSGASLHSSRGLFSRDGHLIERVVPGIPVTGYAASHTISTVHWGGLSPSGEFGIAIVSMAASPPYSAVVLQRQTEVDGQLNIWCERLLMGNTPLRTGANAKPAVIETPPAKWREFRRAGISDGDPDLFWVHGFTSAASDHDELLALSVKGNLVAYREGDTLHGKKLSGPLEHHAVSRNFTAMVWNAAAAGDTPKETLFLDRTPILAVGDSLSAPSTHPGFAGSLTNFLGIDTVRISEPWLDPNQVKRVSIFLIGNIALSGVIPLITDDGRMQGVYRLDVVVTSSVPLCAADFNTSGGLEPGDIFDFLNAWFANDPSADFNGVESVNVQDLFDFLNAWFGGCA